MLGSLHNFPVDDRYTLISNLAVFSSHGENRLAFSTLLLCNYFSIVYATNAGESVALEYSRIPIYAFRRFTDVAAIHSP